MNDFTKDMANALFNQAKLNNNIMIYPLSQYLIYDYTL